MMMLIINLEMEYEGSVMDNPKEVEMSKPLDNVPIRGNYKYVCYP
jgi:hypothetical protein